MHENMFSSTRAHLRHQKLFARQEIWFLVLLFTKLQNSTQTQFDSIHRPHKKKKLDKKLKPV